MPFPKFKNKHLEEALFTAHDYCSYKKWSKNAFPRKMIFCYQRSTLAYFKRKYRGKFEKIKLYNNQEILRIGDIGLMRMNGIGAPHAVTFMEEMIACGTREFINMGTAGGLSETGVFVCNKAVRDEGTSHHYLPDSVYVSSDESLTKRLVRSLDSVGIEYQLASTWTIDAPYRETKAEVKKYSKQGISTVEMEASALFAVAKYRKVNIASVFVVSYLLGKKWLPKFHRFDVKKSQKKLIDIAIKCLGGK